MENNEIMTNKIKESTENVESKKINPATGIVAGLAIVGTYCLVLKTAEAAKKLVKEIKAKRAESVDNDISEDDIFEED